MAEVIAVVDDGSSEFVSPAVVAALEEKIRDVIGAALVAGSNVTLTVNDAGNTITIAASGGGGGFSFTDPNADRIGFWDDSAGAFAPLTHQTPLFISGTTLGINTGSTSSEGVLRLASSAEATAGTDASKAITPATLKTVADTKLNTADAPELIRDTMGTALVAGSNVTITVNDAGDTITIASSGGSGATWGGITGTLSSQTDLQTALDGKITAFADPNADRIVFWDDSAGAFVALTASTGLTISGTSMTVRSASTSQTGIVELADFTEAQGTSSTLAVTPEGLTGTRGLYVGVNAQTGTSYAPALADQGKLVTCTNAAAITVTLPSNATTAFPVGTQVDFVVLGAGMVTFAAGSGATANGTPSLVTRAQYSAATAIKVSTDGWVVVGDLATP